MIQIMKRLALIFTVMFFVTVVCATAGSVQKLGGNPAVLSTGNTIGMSDDNLQEILGPPMEEDTCNVPAEINGKPVRVKGKSMLWKHEVINMAELTHNEYGIVACLLKGIVVAEHREWVEIRGGRLHRGSSDSVDADLVQDVVSERVKKDGPKTRLDKLIEANPGPEFEI